jgi:acyl-coenzyme A thioesterase PaaI-like protein
LTANDASAPHPVLAVQTDDEVTPEVAATRRAATAARRVIAAMVNNSASTATMGAAADDLERLAASLEPTAGASRYDGTPGVRIGGDNAVILESHPMIGPSNPLAPPLVITRDDRRAYATGTYDRQYEGPPGRLHGGFIAAAFDQVVGAAAALSGRVFLTGTLVVRYRAATPLNVPLRFEAELDKVEARRIHASGRLVVDGEVTAEAEGVMIAVDQQLFHEA